MIIDNNNSNFNQQQLNSFNQQQNMQNMQGQNFGNQYTNGFINNSQMCSNTYINNGMIQGNINPMHQQMMNNFTPLVPVTVNKDYITTMIIASAIIIMLMNTSGNAIGLSVFGFFAILGYNIYCISKMKRCGIKLTMSGCLLTDALIFIVCTVIFVAVSKWSLFSTLVKLTWWSIQCAIAQIITSIILDTEDKRKIKKLKNMEKQRKQYERKMDKIYGNRNN